MVRRFEGARVRRLVRQRGRTVRQRGGTVRQRGRTVRRFGAAVVIALNCTVAAAQNVIERVLARVDASVIMLTDVRAAIGLGLVDAPAGPDGERRALDQLIDRQVLLHEVARFPPPEPTDGAIEEAAALMRARAGARLPELMNTTGIDDARIRELARDTLRIQAYVGQRFGAAATLGDADVGQWLRESRKRASVIEPSR
jgi:hypothetical protein